MCPTVPRQSSCGCGAAARWHARQPRCVWRARQPRCTWRARQPRGVPVSRAVCGVPVSRAARGVPVSRAARAVAACTWCARRACPSPPATGVLFKSRLNHAGRRAGRDEAIVSTSKQGRAGAGWVGCARARRGLGLHLRALSRELRSWHRRWLGLRGGCF